MEFTAVIKKGEKQFVALCPEVDVASQGYSVEDALSNLKEAVELYVEEMGLPQGLNKARAIVTSFAVNTTNSKNVKTATSLG